MTIAKQLNVKEFPLLIRNSKGQEIYFENSDGLWYKREYDSDSNQIYAENSYGYWIRYEYDSNGNHIYTESSYGTIYDNRPKTDVQKAIELLTKEGLIVDGKILKQ